MIENTTIYRAESSNIENVQLFDGNRSVSFSIAMLGALVNAADRMILGAIADRPADDLQQVYEKYNRRPMDKNYGYSLKDYFVVMGDIESVKVLIKYGENFAKPAYINAKKPIINARDASQYEMIKLLADIGGATMSPEEWYQFMYEYIYRGKDYVLKDVSESKLDVLEYLLDHGTPANSKINQGDARGLLYFALMLNPKDAAEQHYKDSVIRMLTDRGAKLAP